METAITLATDGAALSGPNELAGLCSIMAVALAVVLVVAALTKVRRSATKEMEALRLPFPRTLAVVVPMAELTAAGLLVLWPPLGAAIAAALLVAFTVVIVVTLRSGREVSCGCLGSLSEQPVSLTAVVRNGALLVMALGASTSSGLSRPDVASLAAFTGFVLVSAIASQLLGLRLAIGRLWSVQLAGESRRSSSMRRLSP